MTENIGNKTGRVTGVYGPRLEIQVGDDLIQARASGRLKYGDTGKSLVAVGDFVEISIKKGNLASIERILNRNKVISRPAIEKEGMVQIIVSNVDRMVVVTSTANPDFKPGAVDRLLVVAFKEDIKPIVVINKIDLAIPETFLEFTEAWRKIGCKILCTSAKAAEHIDELGELLRHGTSVVVGHSGVGKSSLLNKLNPELKIKIGGVSDYTGKGKHTTSRVNLYKIFPDGWVADTPGLRDLGLVGVTRKNLHLYYPEFAPFETRCQFTDCIHIEEPSCAVKGALDKGDPSISKPRYQNYLNISESLRKY